MNEKLIEVYERFSNIDPTPSSKNVKISSTPYRSLMGVLMSAQTKDENTQKAMDVLFQLADTPQEMVKISYEKIQEAIKVVGFYNRKAQYILDCSQELLDKFGGEVPSNRSDLMSLTGIGRKSADVILRFVYDQPTIAVDTHVHRVCNRLGICKTNNADQTANVLEKDTPDEYKMRAHSWLIEFGRATCTAVGEPKCSECPFQDICAYKKTG